LNKSRRIYNNFSLRAYHYKKKYDAENNLRANGGVNEFSLNLGQGLIIKSNQKFEFTFNYGVGLGGMLTALEMEGHGSKDWEDGLYSISTKNRKGYEFQGYGGNIHVGVTAAFKIYRNVNLFVDLEMQSHFHHLNTTTLTWNGPEVLNNDGSIKYSSGQVLYNSDYNAFGVAGIVSYGLHYRF
jgi:hypothetical protein